MIDEETFKTYYETLEQIKNKAYIYINCKEVVIDGKHYIIPTDEEN